MPKPIKKKLKPSAKAEEKDIKGLLGKVKGGMASHGRRLTYAAIAAAVAVALVAGIAFYKSSTERSARKFEYEGYKLYFGLYGTKPLARTERYKLALENFRKAYKLRGSPMALYYTASTEYALGNLDAAVSALRELESKFSGDVHYLPLARYRMAMVNLHAGKTAEALKTLDALYDSGTEIYSDLALAEAARILEGEGKAQEAKVKYEKLAKEFPGSPFIAKPGMTNASVSNAVEPISR